MRYGPEYGTPAADGSRWFLDVGKLRLAHYDAEGRFLEAVRVPRRLLVNGRYFRWQSPHVLADGTVVATRLHAGGAALLRLRDRRLDELPLDRMLTGTYDDGRLLFAQTRTGRIWSIDLETGQLWRVPAYLTPSGTPFTVVSDFDHGTIRVERSGMAWRLVFRTASGNATNVGAPVRAGSEGSLHLFLLGGGQEEDTGQLVGSLSIDPHGRLGRVEPFLNPHSPTDRGTDTNLVMAPGCSTPMLVLVMRDGVHVYSR